MVLRQLPGLVIAMVVVALAGCASRPTAEVLQPVTVHQSPDQKVSLLAVTNRVKDKDGYASTWAGSVSYERYSFSIPSERDATTIVYPTAKPDPKQQFLVLSREKLTPQEFAEDVVRSRDANDTVAVFVHGYNYSYQEALYRTAQLAGDAKTLSPPILFSWPSAESASGYVADRDATMSSRTDLDALLRTLGENRRIKRIVLFAHSMGSFLSVEAVRQLKLEGRGDVVGKIELVLASADIDVDLFRSQMRDIGPMRVPITLLVAKADRALTLSSFLGRERPRIGQLDVDDPAIQEAAKLGNVRVIDITSLKASDGLGHDRYAELARFGSEISRLEQRSKQSGAFIFEAAGAGISPRLQLAGQTSIR